MPVTINSNSSIKYKDNGEYKTIFPVAMPIALDAYRTAAAQDAIDQKQNEDISDLKGAIQVLEPAATNSDVGKFLKVKTVSGNKATEYEFENAGNGELRLICDYTTTEAVSKILKTVDDNGNPFRLKRVYAVLNLVSTGTASSIKFAGVDSNIFIQSIAGLDFRTPGTAGKQNNYAYLFEYFPGIIGPNSGLGCWQVVGLPRIGLDRNDTYTAYAIPSGGQWSNPWREDFSYMTNILLISVNDDAIGAGTRIQIWGEDA